MFEGSFWSKDPEIALGDIMMVIVVMKCSIVLGSRLYGAIIVAW